MKKELTPEQKKQRLETIVKYGALLGACIFLGPLYLTILHGLGALLALGIAGGVIFTTVQFIPYFAAKIGNWRLKALKAEAAKNPIETLQNDYGKRQTALQEFHNKIVTFSAEIKNFADKLIGFNKQYPEETQKFKDQLSKMKQLLEIRQHKYQQAQDNLAEYELEIQKASAIWDMGCAAARMNEAAGMTEEDFLAKIQVETALNSVQTNLNQAFAELEISLLDDDKEKAKKLFTEKQRAQLENKVDADLVPVQENKTRFQKLEYNK